MFKHYKNTNTFMNENAKKNYSEKMKKDDKEVFMPDVIVDLTDDTKTVEEAIEEAETIRKQLTPWYKKITNKVKRIFKR